VLVKKQQAIQAKLKLAEVDCKPLQMVEKQKIGTF